MLAMTMVTGESMTINNDDGDKLTKKSAIELQSMSIAGENGH